MPSIAPFSAFDAFYIIGTVIQSAKVGPSRSRLYFQKSPETKSNNAFFLFSWASPIISYHRNQKLVQEESPLLFFRFQVFGRFY